MKKFKVKYEIIQDREFYAPSEEHIKTILRVENAIRIISIEEIPSDDDYEAYEDINNNGPLIN